LCVWLDILIVISLMEEKIGRRANWHQFNEWKDYLWERIYFSLTNWNRFQCIVMLCLLISIVLTNAIQTLGIKFAHSLFPCRHSWHQLFQTGLIIVSLSWSIISPSVWINNDRKKKDPNLWLSCARTFPFCLYTKVNLSYWITNLGLRILVVTRLQLSSSASFKDLTKNRLTLDVADQILFLFLHLLLLCLPWLVLVLWMLL
jgi:hypothetical protein